MSFWRARPDSPSSSRPGRAVAFRAARAAWRRLLAGATREDRRLLFIALAVAAYLGGWAVWQWLGG